MLILKRNAPLFFIFAVLLCSIFAQVSDDLIRLFSLKAISIWDERMWITLFRAFMTKYRINLHW
ncbi:hypothetical protein [Neobacillus terrae]|uniref:hypothetical protein n=1 Tax=Neobacillus terrae TaxID=3034837 RepID=UPI0014091B8A|nr:hypothetical protein [Neobacillus terrae]NHM33049.1 hypothetical protein [Neobacillus terrae]